MTDARARTRIQMATRYAAAGRHVPQHILGWLCQIAGHEDVAHELRAKATDTLRQMTGTDQ